ncbi:hypothetical protein G6011_03790 [Alternaria panax]|uniref:Gfd2/YDR514C-like C-terminal domain-containing protein n=1 Tax=Alternaria panax TaxID=48097 RepID=A0AAD4IFP0_9PLEO|nr:hypothetical protein G6011_03790 [Alternaria panax]
MDSIGAFFKGKDKIEILEYCLGFDKPGAPALAEHVVLIALECGTFPKHLVEVGLHILERKDARSRLWSPGPHSANILNNVAYHHLRLLGEAHFANRFEEPNMLEDNHFGTTRFVDHEEAKEFLQECFGRRVKMETTIPPTYGPVTEEYAECEFGPIVLLNFQKPQLRPLQSTFGCHPSIWKNVVATINAREIATEQGFNWREDPRTLQQLTGDLGISYPNSYTTADRAAYTLIDAVQMAMRPRFPPAQETIMSVVNFAMLHSQSLIPDWGTGKFCTKCGSHHHRRRQCRLPQAWLFKLENMSNPDLSPSISLDHGCVASPAPPPSETQQLASALAMKTGRQVLSHCLGLSTLEGVPSAVDNMIVVAFDTENWVGDHDRLTELGVSTFDSRDMRALNGADMHGENLLNQVYFYHARILENAHLLNVKFCVGDPDQNHYGQTRFLTAVEAKSMLKEMFEWPVDPRKLELGVCPIVVLGHALNGDMAMLRSTLDFDAMALGTVVKIIDTQCLAKECGYAPSINGNQIGLGNLVAKCGFEYRDPHTASNDAAMTLISAVQMLLPPELKPNDGGLQKVVDDIEAAGKHQQWNWGNAQYCLRCGKFGHTKDNYRNKRCFAKVKCTHCAASQVAKRKQAAGTHRTECCISYAMHGTEVVPAVEAVANAIAGQVLAEK